MKTYVGIFHCQTFSLYDNHHFFRRVQMARNSWILPFVLIIPFDNFRTKRSIIWIINVMLEEPDNIEELPEYDFDKKPADFATKFQVVF